MEIKELTLFSKNIDKQEIFYNDILGFPTSRNHINNLTINAGSTTINLEKSSKSHLYHFAFLIPTGSLESAISYLESRGIRLLPYKDDKIIYFNNGTAIYFFDEDRNIVEFIERPLLDYVSLDHSFSIEDIQKVNEIGLAVSNPKKTTEELTNKFGVEPLANAPMKEDFCWAGDHNGAIIVTKLGRNWLPTNIRGTYNNFSISYVEGNILHKVLFKKDNIQLID